MQQEDTYTYVFEQTSNEKNSELKLFSLVVNSSRDTFLYIE